MNKIIEILMKRDHLSKEEATEQFKEAKEEALQAIQTEVSFESIEEILQDNLGLEPDYMMDLLF